MSNVQVSNLRANVEGKAGDETVRNLELEQLRRQLHQLQTSSEVHVHVLYMYPRRACAARVTVVVVCVCRLVANSLQERLFVFKPLSHTLRATKVKIFVGFSLKPLRCGDPAPPPLYG